MKSTNSYTSRSNPLSISELLNNNDTYAPSYPSFEEPKNYYSYIEKLINQTKNVEAEMKRNYDHARILFDEFFRLLETTEMVAFDIMYVDCLWGEIEFKDFYDFITKCKNATFVFDHPTEQDIQQAADHIQYLHSIIQTCCNDFLNFDARIRIEPPQHPMKIYKYLEGLTDLIEEDIKKTEIKKYEPTTIAYDYGDDVKTFQENSKMFIEKMLDFVQPNHDSNQTIAPNRSILGIIFHKMNNIRQLQLQIKEIKKDIINHKYDGIMNLDPQSIQNSPVYQAVLGSAAFLRSSINNFLSEQPEIDNCEASIENSSISFSKLQHPCQETVKSIEKLQEQIKESIAKKHKDLIDQNNDIIPFYDLFFSDAKIDKIYKLIENNKNLDVELTNLLEAEQSKQLSLNNNNAADKISVCIDAMQQLSDIRSELFELCKKCAEERKDESKMQKKLFTLAADVLVHKERQHNYDRITQVFVPYKNSLDEVFQLFNKEPVEFWCRDVNSALDELQKVLDEQDELIKMNDDNYISPTMPSKEDDIEDDNDTKSQSAINEDDEIRRLELEIEQLEKDLVDVSYEKMQIEEEVGKKKEELFEQIQMNDIYIIYQESNQHKTEKIKEFKEAVICSQCKERICDVVIVNSKKSCNHAFCRKCVELKKDDESGKCPICGDSYKNEDIIEFSFNPKNS